MMRILLHGLQAGNRSGTGRYTCELAAALARLENAPDVFCLWPRDMPSPAPEENIRLVRLASSSLGRFWNEQVASKHLARKYEVDLVHYPASVAGRPSAVPQVVTVHDLCYKRHPEWFSYSRVLYYRMFMDAGIRHAARIIADSMATAEDIHEFLGVPSSRIDIIPLGVSPLFHPASEEDRTRLRNRYALPEAFFLFVGTLEPRKNLPRLMEAWASLGDDIPDLVIAGRTGWKTNPGAWGTAAETMQAKIHFLDHIPQDLLPALYSEAKAFIWPSLMEGFGLPVLEAMACGTPVITSNTSCLPEVVGDAALTVDPADVHALADAMETLWEDRGLQNALRVKGLERATMFTWERTAAMTLETYRRACEE